ncbi:hypothetical protein PMAYCL1PPCAC_15028, partial [Pristionchus mayeri]
RRCDGLRSGAGEGRPLQFIRRRSHVHLALSSHHTTSLVVPIRINSQWRNSSASDAQRLKIPSHACTRLEGLEGEVSSADVDKWSLSQVA